MFKTRYAIPGSPPATLETLPVLANAAKSVIRLLEYDSGGLTEKEITSLADLPPLSEDGKVRWLDIEGLGDPALFSTLGEKYGLHPLALEDSLHTGQRPKVEPYPNHLFIIVQMVYRDQESQMCGEQVSFFLRQKFLITIQEEVGTDVFGPVRDRLRSGRGFIRRLDADYLAYALIDAIIDHCFPILENVGEALEELEDEVVERPHRACVQMLHQHKRTLTQMRRFVWPERDVCNALLHDETGIISTQTKIYLRDCYDHTVQIMDLVESYRDVVSGMMEMYLSAVGMRTNEIMRVLTVLSAIFIPLTFVAGVYGMNFDNDAGKMPFNMPELHWPYAYLTCWVVMISIAVVQILFFKRKKWL